MKLSIVALAAAVFNRACVLPAAAAEVAAAFGFEKKVPSMAEPLRAENEELRCGLRKCSLFFIIRKCSLVNDWFLEALCLFVSLDLYLDYLFYFVSQGLEVFVVATLTAVLGVLVINYFFGSEFVLVLSTTSGEFVAPTRARAAPTRA